jgi:hypothetical protein
MLLAKFTAFYSVLQMICMWILVSSTAKFLQKTMEQRFFRLEDSVSGQRFSTKETLMFQWDQIIAVLSVSSLTDTLLFFQDSP